jgi:hypothetical protein
MRKGWGWRSAEMAKRERKRSSDFAKQRVKITKVKKTVLPNQY